MINIINKMKAFFADEQGGEVAEWAVVVAILVAIAASAYGVNLSTAISSAVTRISTTITAPAP